MRELKIQPWFFYVEPLEGESLSHFLGRFRRANYLPVSSLGQVAGIGAVVARWEKFYLNPFPSLRELEALTDVVQVDAKRLLQMLPPKGVGMNYRPIRLCGYCYQESPCHRIKWQFKDAEVCEHHQRFLLLQCPRCCIPFPIPAGWEKGVCQRCFMSFAYMKKYQKSVGRS